MTSHSYAWWSGRLAGILDTLLADPHDELRRVRARRLLDEFEAECAERERAIRDPESAPQSIRAELDEIAQRPERIIRLPRPRGGVVLRDAGCTRSVNAETREGA